MKGPGLRTDIDVRRAWQCPTCGKSQRLTMDFTAPRCPCVRDGVPMKLAEGQRPGRTALRPELRSMVDRIQAGEEFARLAPLMGSEGEGATRDGGPRPRGRPPRQDRADGPDNSRPPSEPRPETPREPLPEVPSAAAVMTSEPPPIREVAPSPPAPVSAPAGDDFGAGVGTDD